jgi:hypothetical protein
LRRFAPEWWTGGLRPPYENHENQSAKPTPGDAFQFFVFLSCPLWLKKFFSVLSVLSVVKPLRG